MQEIQDNPSVLNQSAYFLISAASLKQGLQTKTEIKLLNEVIKNYPGFLTDQDYSRKADLFLNLAKIEFNLQPPRYQLPQLVNKLRIDLKENIDKLAEEDVLRIIEAYQYLPTKFPVDLIDEFRQMVVVTLQQNPNNLKPGFLLKYLQL